MRTWRSSLTPEQPPVKNLIYLKFCQCAYISLTTGVFFFLLIFFGQFLTILTTLTIDKSLISFFFKTNYNVDIFYNVESTYFHWWKCFLPFKKAWPLLILFTFKNPIWTASLVYNIFLDLWANCILVPKTGLWPSGIIELPGEPAQRILKKKN